MKKVISILLCFLLVVSTSGVAYAQHFCGDFEMMATLTFGQEELSCGMATHDNDGCDENEGAKDEHGCCDNQYTQVDIDDNFSPTELTIEMPTNFVSAFVTVFVLPLTTEISTNRTVVSDYRPPPVIKDFPVLYETFLI